MESGMRMIVSEMKGLAHHLLNGKALVPPPFKWVGTY